MASSTAADGGGAPRRGAWGAAPSAGSNDRGGGSKSDAPDASLQQIMATPGSRCNQPGKADETIRYDNGDVYEGELRDGKRHGNGVFRYADGSVYDGAWKDGKRHGRGKMKCANGDVYDGQWVEGKRHGKGVYTFASGTVLYDGEWKGGLMHGTGTKTLENDDVYEGCFKDDAKHGQGTQRYANGNVYEGQWKNGMKHGTGTYRWMNGDVYEGQLVEGTTHGTGTKTYANGDVYVGEWQDGKRHGRGVFRFVEGDFYEGQFVEGEMKGKGKMKFANGDVYEGEFKDGEQHGKGVYTYASGTVMYDGEWKGGLMHGRGTKTLENGEVYEGCFKDDAKHGQGTQRYANGDVYEGQLVEGKAHGIGTMTWENGDVYEGQWKEGMKHGRGVFRDVDGDVYEGQFVEGEMQGKGKVKLETGDVYEGEFEDGEQHGKGVYTYASGTVMYDGEWKGGLMHGTGTHTSENGDVYVGEWQDGERHGIGTMTWENGDVYEGEWVDGEETRGKMTWANGDTENFLPGRSNPNDLQPNDARAADRTTARMEEGLAQLRELRALFNAGVQPNDLQPNDTTSAAGRELPGGYNRERQGGPGENASGHLHDRSIHRRYYNHERKLRSERSQQRRTHAATKTCERCGADDYHYKLRVCSGCDLALYCSASCQEAASGSHRRICDIVSELPSQESDRLVLLFGKEKANDFDAGLRYGKKYMGNLKHLAIDTGEMTQDDTVKLSAKQLSSLLRSKEGALESVFLFSDSHHEKVHGVFENDTVWKEMHSLKQLRLYNLEFDDFQPVHDIITRQKNTLKVLSLPFLGIDWHKAKCRRTVALAVSACKHLVKLDLQGCSLMDPDLKFMLQDLPNLRILGLARYVDDGHQFSDQTCGLIARKCSGLQELDLENHDDLSVRGIRKIFEGCVHLRSFATSSCKLSCKDILSLLNIAPQLLCLYLDKIDATHEEIIQIIEATGGRTFFQGFDGMGLSAATKEKYDGQIDLIFKIQDKWEDPEVANEWEELGN